MLGAFEGPFGHLAFDDSGVDSQSSCVEPVQDLAGGFGDGGGQVFRGKKPLGR